MLVTRVLHTGVRLVLRTFLGPARRHAPLPVPDKATLTTYLVKLRVFMVLYTLTIVLLIIILIHHLQSTILLTLHFLKFIELLIRGAIRKWLIVVILIGLAMQFRGLLRKGTEILCWYIRHGNFSFVVSVRVAPRIVTTASVLLL